MSEPLSDAALEALVRRGRVLAAEIVSLTDQKKAITDRIDREVAVGWKLVVDNVPATKKTGNRSFSSALALAQFSLDEKKACISTGIDHKAVRDIADRKGITEACMESPDETKTSVKL